jgi:hypothetical protein
MHVVETKAIARRGRGEKYVFEINVWYYIVA